MRASAASRSPAAQPPVRVRNTSTRSDVRITPKCASSSAVSKAVKLIRSARSSHNPTARRSRGSANGGSNGLHSTSWTPAGRLRGAGVEILACGTNGTTSNPLLPHSDFCLVTQMPHERWHPT